MKKIILTLIAAITVIIGVYAYPVDNTRKGFVDVASFENITVSAPLRVKVLHADTFSINVIAKDSILRDVIKYDVEDGVLNIYTDGYVDPREPKAKVVITTSNHTLPEVIPGDGYYVANVRTNR